MILAAGRGERMRELTDTVPKPLLEVAGKPLIQHHIERLRAAGITELVINLAYRGAQIREHLGNGQAFGVTIAYSQEPDGALETGGGIFAALHLLGGGPFIAVNSDIWTVFDFSTLIAGEAIAHLVLVPNPDHNSLGDFGIIGRKIVEHGGIMSTFSGIAVYTPDLFSSCTATRFPLAPLLREAISAGNVTGELFDGLWSDIGTPERLALARDRASTEYAPRRK
jgi:MurNAc alpha-1-phosphate uridylyltransferase